MPGKSGKRKVNFNRELVSCSICDKQLQKDNFRAHKATFHPNEPSAKYIVINDSKQKKLNFSVVKKKDDENMNASDDPADSHLIGDPGGDSQDPGEGASEMISPEEEDRLWNTGISPGITPPGSPRQMDLDIVLPFSDLEFVSRNPGLGNNNEISPKAIDGSSWPAAATSSSACNIDQDQEHKLEDNSGKSENICPEPEKQEAVNRNEEDKLEDNSGKSENICPEPEKQKAVNRNEKDKPHQPLLTSYAPYHDGQNKRDFQPEWFQKFPWLEFDESSKSATCFACNKFGKEASWKFQIWKNSSSLGRHSQKNSHKDAMAKWTGFVSSRKNNTSVLKQVDSQHAQEAAKNQAYLKCLIESVAYCALQGIAFQGHDENRQNLTQKSDTNRGNYLELLSLRSQECDVLKLKLDEPVKNLGKGHGHGWYTHKDSQNEMLQDIQDAVVTGIITEIKSSATDDGEYFYSVIVDESSDMSNHEQFSLSISSVNKEGKKAEDFVKLIKVNQTNGEYLCETLVKNLQELGLDTASCVSLAGDGASNISGHEKGLAVRFKEFAPLCVYVHCYAHRLNLAVKDLLSSIQLLRNVLGTVQEIYNFLEGSPKRSEIFKSAEIEDEDSVTKLKNQGATRWGAKGDSVIAVSRELKRCVKALDIISKEKDAKVSAKAKSLLRNIYGAEFIFGISLLERLLTPVNRLSDYLQGRSVDMRKAREAVKLLITTLEGLKNDERFNELWQLSQRKSTELKLFVEEDDSLDITFDFDEAKLPRRINWTKSPKEYSRVTHYEASLDKIIAVLNVRFMDKDKDIVLDMVAIVNDAQVDGDVFARVGETYSINAEDLKSEHQMFQCFKVIKYFHHFLYIQSYSGKC